jgi:integrase
MTLKSITIKTVQALKPGETVWDAGHNEAVKGFGVRRQRGDAVYVTKYRTFGRQRFVTIGRHGSPWTPDLARREAKRLLGLVAAGKDPQTDKAEAKAKAADTLGKVAKSYLEYAKKKQKPRSYAETERHLLINWKPLHPDSIFHIQRRHIAARLAEIESERGAVSAARARAALSAMFNWAVREGFNIPGNPVFGTNRPAEPKSRKRVLTDDELAEIWTACRDDDHGRITKLLLLTGQRRDEVGGMHRTEIDETKKLWTIQSVRTKNHQEHVVPLSDSALAIISASPRIKDREHLFGGGPRRDGDEHRGFSGWSKAKAALDERILQTRRQADPRAKPLPWRLHDLRRTCATVMADRLGVQPYIVEAVLNHITGHKSGVAGVYNRARYEIEVRAALTKWADHVAVITTDRLNSISADHPISS